MTELAAPQISSLMEALPGIAAVLRSPVANAMVAICRSAAGLEEFQLTHGEELLRFGVRRNLLTPEEVDKVLDELREVVSKRPAKPVPPVVKKAAVAPVPDVPKVPHRPKGIQLKPVPKRPMPTVAPMAPPPPVPAPVAKVVAKPVAKAPAAAPVASAKKSPVVAKKVVAPAAKPTVAKVVAPAKPAVKKAAPKKR